MFVQRLASIPLLFASVAVGGINWKSVWLEAPNNPTVRVYDLVVRVGETKPFKVMGLDGADNKAELTKSPYLKITSSDPDILGIDTNNFAFVGKKSGRVEVRISFSEATAAVKAVVYTIGDGPSPRAQRRPKQ